MAVRTRRKKTPARAVPPGVVRHGRAELRLRPRLYLDGEIALGPGKADLLSAIARTGSIRQAAGELGMSYMRAWTLVRTMNACFKWPLVNAERGGRGGGEAHLTPAGERALRLYGQLAQDGMRAAAPAWRALRQLLQD